MLTQKHISKLLNIRKSSSVLLVAVLSVLGFSLGCYQYLDIPKVGKVLFTDSNLQAGPPWPD